MFHSRKIDSKINNLQERSSRSQTDFSGSSPNASHFGLSSLQYFASKIWNIVLLKLKNLNGAEMFKSEIRKWEPSRCKC